MSKLQSVDGIDNKDTDERRVRHLERELSSLRESAFNSLRDVKALHEKEIGRLKDDHREDLKRLAREYDVIIKNQLEKKEKIFKQQAESKINEIKINLEKKLREEMESAQKHEENARQNEIEKTLGSAQKRWKEDAQRELSRAAREWVAAEEERFRKFQVELVRAKSMELAEREAYWRAELARVTGFSGSRPQERRGQDNRDNTGRKKSNGNRGGGKFVIFGFILTFIIGAALYLLALQWQAPVERVIERIVSEQNKGVQDTIYAYMPWLKRDSSNDEPTVQETAVVRSVANLRENPGLRARIIQVLAVGTRVHVGEIHSGWSHIIVDDAKKDAGWIHSSLLNTAK